MGRRESRRVASDKFVSSVSVGKDVVILPKYAVAAAVWNVIS
jgi:hypothetical protein